MQAIRPLDNTLIQTKPHPVTPDIKRAICHAGSVCIELTLKEENNEKRIQEAPSDDQHQNGLSIQNGSAVRAGGNGSSQAGNATAGGRTVEGQDGCTLT
jgi:hypothetical protein